MSDPFSGSFLHLQLFICSRRPLIIASFSANASLMILIDWLAKLSKYCSIFLPNKDEYKEAERENRQSELEKKQIEQIERQLAGFQPKPKDTEPLSIDEAKNTIEEGEEAVLIYTEEQKKHFIRILEDIDDFLNNEGKLNLNAEGESGRNDQYKNFLLRNNCILYGAPGTGKTEFVKELNHVLINRYGRNSPERPPVVNLDPSDPNHGLTQDDEEKKPEPTIPIFVISGASLMSTGKDEPKTFEKFIITLKKAKNNFFKNPDEEGNIGEDSKLPYIVFVDEADQAKNSLTYNPQAKNNLEEFKNFFSQAEDGGGLKKEAQDLNSICIFATNNYETIDPAMKRRGRLGTSLNFT
ncbi:5720_t:CDS:2 [Cetraspora pellucida]|uniref:5720_t:CDS:1 n=1 Tax=Cetraspora pellucida TaxID=1433469 RepID=A0ACA9MF51_9GLOM|nr:5720_t:CDS:2 [Cetraspora pellucida]